MAETSDTARPYDAVAPETWDSIEPISMPIIKDFARHWYALRDGYRAPSRTQLDPAQMKPFLPHMFLLDVVRPEMRFRGRLVGTKIVASLGFDYTGRFLDEVISESYYTTLRRDLVDVAENAILHYRVMNMAWNNRPHALYHRLYAPLRTDSDRIDIIAGIACMVRASDPSVAIDPIAAIIEGDVVQQSRIVLAG